MILKRCHKLIKNQDSTSLANRLPIATMLLQITSCSTDYSVFYPPTHFILLRVQLRYNLLSEIFMTYGFFYFGNDISESLAGFITPIYISKMTMALKM